MAMCETRLLQFVPFESCIEPTFWHKYTKLKLDVYMLEENVRHIWGSYSPQYHRVLNVDYTSFNKKFSYSTNNWEAHGYHLNMNTLESFKKHDKVKMINNYGRMLKDVIISGEAIDSPSLLVKFIVLTFADLKKYHFYYWFAFPALAKPRCFLTEPTCGLTNLLNHELITFLFQRHRELPFQQQGFFGILKKDSEVSVHILKDFISILDSEKCQDCYWGFIDPCEDTEHPGWPLRNFLLLIYIQCPKLKEETINVICLRKRHNSLLLKVKFEDADVMAEEKWIGWETNLRSKFGPRFVDLSSNMNPIELAEESVDLNLRLMKWRLVPDLDLTLVKATSCLLLGAGTLGCSVARNLLAWGVDKITFVDNGNVSYSNPVRQSLYTFKDCQGEKSKAEAAASALKAIFPSVKSTGVKMTIAMPGRGVSDAASVPQLETLVSDHDVVFLLTDTRESRWLPTLLAAKHNKIAITAALGFDTYLVLRHGKPDSSSRLGCYFCNDVTAPGNSVQDRTLDQQCTVTRPGVSHIAAALAVEMMVSLLQQPDKNSVDTSSSACLGHVPHSIRGFLFSWTQMTPSTPAFSQCTACSIKVIEEYQNRGMDFLNEVFLRSSYLEDLTGLTELHKATTLSDVMEFSDDEEM